MQRASASHPSTPTSADPPSKRRKTSLHNTHNHNTPTRSHSGQSTPNDQHTLRWTARVASQHEGLDYETPWVLNLPQHNGTAPAPNPKSESEEEEEEEEEDIWRRAPTGRQTFGGFKRAKHTKFPSSKETQKPARDDADADLSSASESESQASDNDSDSDSGSDSDAGPARRRTGPRSARVASLNAGGGMSLGETMSPLRRHAQQQEQRLENQTAKQERKGKRKSEQAGGKKNKNKKRKTM
jgi:hypothetical protein